MHMPYIVGIIAILEAESGMPASQNKQTTTVGQIVSIMRRPDSWPLAALMAFVAIGWVQWVHTRIFESHDANTTGVVVHWLRDGSLAFPLALIATGCGFWVADRFVAITTAGGSAGVASVFGGGDLRSTARSHGGGAHRYRRPARRARRARLARGCALSRLSRRSCSE